MSICLVVSQRGLLPNTENYREAAKTRRQRNVAQMKQQIKTPEKERNKMRQAIYQMQSSKHRL